MKGFITDIEKDTKENDFFRKVIYTSKHSQLVLMSLNPGEEIGEEVHDKEDQFFRFEKGEGKVVIDGLESPVKDDFAVVIPAGVNHNVVNTSLEDPLKFYTIYSPAHHPEGTVHKTKIEADLAEKDHH